MKNIFSWHGILSDKILLDLGVSSLLNRYLVVALTITVDSSDALLKSKFIVSAIPSEWIKSGKYRNGNWLSTDMIEQVTLFYFNFRISAICSILDES